MSALTPANGKYRNTWKIFGEQLSNKEMLNKFKSGHDKIEWGNVDRFEEEEKVLAGHKVIRFKG